MQPTLVIMVIIFGVQSPEGATFTLHVYILPETCSKIHQLEHFKPVKNSKHSSLLKESSVNTQTVPPTENLPKPEAAHGFSYLWNKPQSGPCNLSNMLNFIEDWDHVCFTAVFWATPKWPWDQPQGQFCHFLICWHVPWIGPVAQIWLLQVNPHLCLHPARVLQAVQSDPQTPFLMHKSPSLPSGFANGQPALGSLPRAALAAPAAAAVGIGSQAAYKQKDNGNRSPNLYKKCRKKPIQKKRCAYRKQQLCCLQVFYGWWRKITMLACALR